MMKKTKKLFAYILIVINFLCVFFIFKLLYMIYYNTIGMDIDPSYVEKIQINGNIILDKKNYDYDNYIEFKNIKLENKFENWEATISNNEKSYILKDNNDKYIARFKISLYPSLVNGYKQMDELIKEDENDLFTRNISSKYLINLFKIYNIKNETDFIKFIYNQRNIGKENVNILSSFTKIKEKYVIQSIVYLVPVFILKTTDTINIKNVSGIYDGYFKEYTKNKINIKDYYLNINNVMYNFEFWNIDNSNFFTDENIKSLLSTLDDIK